MMAEGFLIRSLDSKYIIAEMGYIDYNVYTCDIIRFIFEMCATSLTWGKSFYGFPSWLLRPCVQMKSHT